MPTATPPPAIVETLGRRGLRLTGARRRVADLLGQHAGTFTAADLLDEADRRSLPIGRATVFRALDLFTELGLLERIDLPTGEHAYVACDAVHHHHLVCSVCGRQTEVDDAGVQAIVAAMERQTGYRIDKHRLELYGTCPDCRPQA
jgi:Fe2+ or Zn2+ uptake regulation protein